MFNLTILNVSEVYPFELMHNLLSNFFCVLFHSF